MDIKNYRDLNVWQAAMDLVVQCYQASGTFPKAEQFGLTSQLRRSAISVPSNIAEGNARQHRKECCQFIAVAAGSNAELETQIEIATRLGFLPAERGADLLHKANDVGKMLNGLRTALERS